jgi:hypothetical protein
MDVSYNCVICLTDIDLEEGVLTPCNHRYHSECFFKWIYKNTTCPLCRKQIIDDPTIEGENILREIKRQIEWEMNVYNTLRNNTDVLERNIKIKFKELQNIDAQVATKQSQLISLVNNYQRFINSTRRNNRRGGLLLKKN